LIAPGELGDAVDEHLPRLEAVFARNHKLRVSERAHRVRIVRLPALEKVLRLFL